MRCLLVDCPSSSPVLQRTLLDAGHEPVFADAEAAGERLGPLDLAIVVIDGPRAEPLVAIARLRERCGDVSILAVSTTSEHRRLLDAIRDGVAGHIDFDEVPERLAATVDEIARGGHPVSPRAATILFEEYQRTSVGAPPRTPQLSPRERAILGELGDGATYGQVASCFGLSVNTVRHHVRNAYRKLGAKGREAALRRWRALRA